MSSTANRCGRSKRRSLPSVWRMAWTQPTRTAASRAFTVTALPRGSTRASSSRSRKTVTRRSTSSTAGLTLQFLSTCSSPVLSRTPRLWTRRTASGVPTRRYSPRARPSGPPQRSWSGTRPTRCALPCSTPKHSFRRRSPIATYQCTGAAALASRCGSKPRSARTPPFRWPCSSRSGALLWTLRPAPWPPTRPSECASGAWAARRPVGS
mmetsp:Transcript_25018/g.70732  ORF Transcript_25018/g.70732 Transcript_25018/m.70732 type:complete len:209 (+) Transcript_25018:1-627(+)